MTPISAPDQHLLASRLVSLLHVVRAACGVPAAGVELLDGDADAHAGPTDLWRRASTEVWDRVGRRRGALVLYDRHDLTDEDLPPEVQAHLAASALAVGDLLSVDDLAEARHELAAAVTMTRGAGERRAHRDDRTRRHVEHLVRERARTMLVALEDAAVSRRGGMPEGTWHHKVAEAAAHAREIGGVLDDMAVARDGLDTVVPAVHRLEDLVDAALAEVEGMEGAQGLVEGIQVVSVRDIRLSVGGPEVQRALRHLLLGALVTPAEADRAAHVEIDVEERGSLCLVSVADDGPAERSRDLAAQLASGVGGSDDGDTGLAMAFVRAVAEAHGGRCWVEPSDLGGARVCLTLPVAGTDDLEERRRGAASGTRHPSERPGQRVGEQPDGVFSTPADEPVEPGPASAEPRDDEIDGDDGGPPPDNVRGLFDRR